MSPKTTGIGSPGTHNVFPIPEGETIGGSGSGHQTDMQPSDAVDSKQVVGSPRTTDARVAFSLSSRPLNAGVQGGGTFDRWATSQGRYSAGSGMEVGTPQVEGPAMGAPGLVPWDTQGMVPGPPVPPFFPGAPHPQSVARQASPAPHDAFGPSQPSATLFEGPVPAHSLEEQQSVISAKWNGILERLGPWRELVLDAARQAVSYSRDHKINLDSSPVHKIYINIIENGVRGAEFSALHRSMAMELLSANYRRYIMNKPTRMMKRLEEKEQEEKEVEDMYKRVENLERKVQEIIRRRNGLG